MSIEDERRVTQISSYVRHTFHIHKCNIFAYLVFNSSEECRRYEQSYFDTLAKDIAFIFFFIPSQTFIQIKLIFVLFPYKLSAQRIQYTVKCCLKIYRWSTVEKSGNEI